MVKVTTCNVQINDMNISMDAYYAFEFQKEWDLLTTTAKMVFEEIDLYLQNIQMNKILKFMSTNEDITFALDLGLNSTYKGRQDSKMIFVYEFLQIGFHIYKGKIKDNKFLSVCEKNYDDPHLVVRKFRKELSKYV